MSEFLKQRHQKLFEERVGGNNIQYFRFDNSTADALTGDVDESSAYPDAAIDLAGRIEFNPSPAARALVGLDVTLDATVTFCTRSLKAKNVSLKIGDALQLPIDARRYFIIKVVPEKQLEGEFLETTVAVQRGSGKRG